jgi:hypothetical protein
LSIVVYISFVRVCIGHVDQKDAWLCSMNGGERARVSTFLAVIFDTAGPITFSSSTRPAAASSSRAAVSEHNGQFIDRRYDDALVEPIAGFVGKSAKKWSE